MVSGPLALALLAGAAFALLGVAYKKAAVEGCRPSAFCAVMTLVAAATAGLRAMGETAPWESARFWGLGGAMAALLYLALALVVSVNRLGPASVSWTLLNLSILVPLSLSALLLGEPFLRADALSLALFAGMLWTLRRGTAGAGGTEPEAPASRAYWPLLAALFLANGALQFGFKLHRAWFGDAGAGGLALLYFGGAFILAVAALALRPGATRPAAREWRCGLLAGVCSALGNLLALGSMALPAAAAFPATQGVALLGGVGLAAWRYREPWNRWRTAAMFLGLCVLLLAALRIPLETFWTGTAP